MGSLHINAWFIGIALGLVFFWKLDFFATLLNLKAFENSVPAEFADLLDDATYEESREYIRSRAVLSIGESTFALVVLFAFWWLGGFGWLDGKVRAWGFGPIFSGLIYLGLLYLALRLISLPFAWYSTFGIESKFGFNKITPGLFLKDWVFSLALTALLGGPLLATLLWLFGNIPHAWFWGWLATAAATFALLYLSPALIMPLFNQFTPLEEGELKTEIMNMAGKCDFPVREISIMNGSVRTTKANAFFTGFGSTKRIVLFDTLVSKHSVPEVVSVLAHEIGHFKKKHILKSMALGMASLGCLFALLGALLQNRGLFEAFAVEEFSIHASFAIFFVLIGPVGQALSILGNCQSRKNEFEADAYAREAVGSGEPLISALRKLSVDHRSNLTPHPAYVFLNYSHPPVVERIKALRAP